MNIKICGVRTPEVAQAAVDAGATHIGFVFFNNSPRNISPQEAAQVSAKISGRAKTAAVTVDATDEQLDKIVAALSPNYIQLHGSETPARALEIKRRYYVKIIKAIAVSTAADLKKADEFAGIADHIMFDAKPPKGADLPGGNAVSFNWEILRNFKAGYSCIVSGGLTPENVNEALRITGTGFIDVSSGVESTRGNKDISKVKQFIANALQHKGSI